MSVPTFYIQPGNVAGDNATLTGEELNHARNVLRLRPGDTAHLIDGLGTSCRASLLSLSGREAVFEVTSRRQEPEPALRITMGMGIVPGERYDWAVQKVTELGVTDIVPLITARTEGKVKTPWKRLPRLTRIAVAACKQCGRARFPLLHEPVGISEVNPARYDACIVFWEGAGSLSLGDAAAGLDSPHSCFALVGPVGGLTREEAEGLESEGAVLAGMGPRVLRTETAAAVAAALIQHRWGDMG